jgi:hypothetical protein
MGVTGLSSASADPATLTPSVATLSVTEDAAITDISFTASMGFIPVSYSVTPTLPAGLSLNSTTGVISGTPTDATASASYTITASDGSDPAVTADASVTIEVLAAGGPAPSATIENVNVSGTTGSAMTTKEVIITLANDTFNRIGIGANLASFVTGAPTGITITSGTLVTSGLNQVTLVFAGTPTSAVSGAMSITIPQRALASGASLTVTTNAEAKFTVVAPAPDGDPIAGDFDISGLTATADGSAKAVTIAPKAGKSAGAITRKYAGSITAPSAAGTYAVTFDVAAATGYNAATGLSAGNLVISAAVTTVVASVSAGPNPAAQAAADKIAADKAAAEAVVAAAAAEVRAAEAKVAAEAAAVVKAAADKVEAEARAAAEVIVAAQEAKVAAAVVKAAATTVKPVVTKSGTKMTLDLPDKYYGKIVTIYVGTTVKGKTTYKKLDFFVLDKEDGTANITSKVKLVKGQVIRVNIGSKVVKSVKI